LWLQAVLAPDAVHCHPRVPHLLRQRTTTPVRRRHKFNVGAVILSAARIACIVSPSIVINTSLARSFCFSVTARLFELRSRVARSSSVTLDFVGVLMNTNFLRIKPLSATLR